MNRSKSSLTMALLAGCACISANGTTIFDLSPLTVTGDLLESPVDRLAASVTLVESGDVERSNARHFEQVLGLIPNLNWAGGTSRPRYFQIRGIGESSQFGNEIPASSVGFMIDGIDFTGIGSVAGLFDVRQVEILRGPQAAAFGANALAGMVIIDTQPAGDEVQGKAELTIGDNGWREYGIADGGSIADGSFRYRFSSHHHEDDGYRQNNFLERDDTNARDEWSSRLKLAWDPATNLLLELNLMAFDFSNGYDAWALDNDSFNTSTDEPGQDLQRTLAAGIRATFELSEDLRLSANTSVSDSEILYSYDWDWSNPRELEDLYGPEVYWGTDVTARARDVWSHDLRLTSSETGSGISWATGIYHRSFQEEQDYFGILGYYDTNTTAAYGQSGFQISEKLNLTVAGRLESFEIDFASTNPWATDTNGQALQSNLTSRESLWGGKLALEFRSSENSLLYISLDRGYKAGGVNLDDEVPESARLYDSESLLNLELGWRGSYLDNRLRLQATAFHMDRSDIQVDSSIQLGDGNTFALYKDNAASGSNSGLEFEAIYKASESWTFFANIGLLRTEFDDYQFVDPVDTASVINLSGSDQGYAPDYSYAIGADYRSESGVFLGVVIEGKDSYLFDVLNKQSLPAYDLVRINVGYQQESWSLSFWVTNALDEEYDVRGFYFANEPPFYDNPRKWVSQGAPRQVGVTGRLLF